MKSLPLWITFLLLLPISVSAAVFTDGVGRQVEVPAHPTRIISLTPAVTEILFALDKGDSIVATTGFSDYPAAAKELPKVGEYADPGLENILSFKPDLVIATAALNRPAMVERLATIGIPVYVVYPRNVSESLATIRVLGQLVGATDKAEALANDLRQRIDQLQKRLAGQAKVSVIGTVMLDPLTIAGPDTFVSDIIRLAGGENIAPPGPARYPTWNMESLLAYNPQAIVVSNHPGQPDAQRFFLSWPQLQAVQQKRVITLNADWIHRPGPRMILGIEALAKALHGNF